MNEQIKKTLEPLKSFWSNTSKLVKRILIGGVIGILIIALVLSLLLNSKDYVVIFDQLTEAETSEILAALNGMEIDVKVDGKGSIMVPEKVESQARMALATAGYPKSGLSYYLIEQNSGILTTDYERKQYVNMQLQERIAASIKTLDGVKDTVVTITAPEENVFYLQEKEAPTASVIIHMKDGYSLSERQIMGIQNLVAKSVSGLTKENIALSDSMGNDLVGDSTGSGSTDLSKINVTREIENDIRKKVYSVLEGPYRLSQIKLNVTAEVDTDALVREETTYVPSPDGDNTGVISEETRSEESSSSAQTDGGVPGTSTNSEVPVYPVGGAGGESSSSGSSEHIKYQVSQIKSQSQKSGARIESISIGIAIDKAVFDPGERDSIIELVSYAAGVPRENVTVQNFKFSSEDGTQGPSELPSGPNKILLYGGIGAGILLLIIGLVVFLLLSSRKKKKAAEEALAMEEAEKQAALNALFGEAAEPESIQPITPVQDHRREEIKEFAKNNPEIAAQMIKSWLKSEGD